MRSGRRVAVHLPVLPMILAVGATPCGRPRVGNVGFGNGQWEWPGTMGCLAFLYSKIARRCVARGGERCYNGQEGVTAAATRRFAVITENFPGDL